jgi:hypothetical protein
LPILDEWSVMSDGSIAIVRGQDYHVDWIDANGAVSSSPKLPYNWKRLTDADKQRIADSATTVRDSISRSYLAKWAPGVSPTFDDFGGVVGLRGVVPGASHPLVDTSMSLPISPLSVPEYLPVIGRQSVRADADDRLWIASRPTEPVSGGQVFDVVDRSGRLIDRVQLPIGRTLLGFGAGGNVYLLATDRTGLRIEKVAFR